ARINVRGGAGARVRYSQSEGNPMSIQRLCGLVLLLIGSVMVARAQSPFDAELDHIQQQWAIANYQIANKKEKLQAFEALTAAAHQSSTETPQRAEPLIWEGIVLSTYAGAKGGVGALGLARKSRAVLE